MAWLHETAIRGKRKAPPERGAAAAALGAVLLGPHKAPLVLPPIHAAQHERAGRRGDNHTRPALPLAGGVLPPASGTGHLTRSRPQDSASNAAAPQWEPRKPLGGHRTKGQRVMAVAKIYPEPEQAGGAKSL